MIAKKKPDNPLSYKSETGKQKRTEREKKSVDKKKIRVKKKGITTKQIDEKVNSLFQNLSPEQKSRFKKRSKESWFKEYAKKSEQQLEIITNKVKEGIIQGKYQDTDLSKIDKEEEQRYEVPKKPESKKPRVKKKVKRK